MKKSIVRPYLMPAETRVSALWAFRPEIAADTTLPDWDVNSEIAVSIHANIDLAGVLKDCMLPANTALQMTLSWRSTGTSLRGTIASEAVEGENFFESVLSGSLDGALLAQEVEFILTLHTSTDAEGVSLIAASSAGSILWQKTRSILLEGQGTRFPIEVKDFGNDPNYPQGAAWHLDWHPSYVEAPLLGSLTLKLNIGHPVIADYLQNTSSTSPETQVVGNLIRFDIARQMLSGVLRMEEFTNGQLILAPGSVGAHVLELVNLNFPGETIQTLAATLQSDPALFESKLQAGMQFFRSNTGAR